MKVLNKHEFAGRRGGIEAKYDWDKILDGKIRALDGGEGQEGKDFSCKALTFLTLARNAARKRDMSLNTETTETGVIVQAVPATPEQIKTWGEQDAQRKVDAKKRREEKKAEKNGMKS